MNKLTAIILVLVVGIPMVLGIYWLLWKLYLTVVQALFPEIDSAWTSPDYWIFVGAVFLLMWIGNLFRSSK